MEYIIDFKSQVLLTIEKNIRFLVDESSSALCTISTQNKYPTASSLCTKERQEAAAIQNCLLDLLESINSTLFPLISK